MWVFTPIGFFSATLTNKSYNELPPEQQTGHIMVRARVMEDLERLIEVHQQSPGLGDRPEIFALPGHDYPYRVVMPHLAWTTLVVSLAEAIDYSNFKNAVTDQAATRVEGDARHDLYMKIWGVMHGAEDWLKRRVRDLQRPRPKQGGLSFWQSPGRYHGDPRTDAEMQADYEPARGWEEWLSEDEREAIECEPPLVDGEDITFDIEEDPFDLVIDNPTQDDIARFELALMRSDRRGGKGR